MEGHQTTELGHHEPSGKIRLGLRASFLGDMALELEDMVVRLVRPPKLTGIHGYSWTVRLGISIDVKSFAEVVFLERAEKLANKTVIER